MVDLKQRRLDTLHALLKLTLRLQVLIYYSNVKLVKNVMILIIVWLEKYGVLPKYSLYTIQLCQHQFLCCNLWGAHVKYFQKCAAYKCA